MTPSDAARYGDRHAPVYDRLYGSRFVTDTAVETLASAAAGGRVLELGVGTGRLAIALLRRGVAVDGIEGSSAMIERLRAQPGGDRVTVHQVDLVDFDLPRHDYAVAVCAVSTLFMLDHHAQRTCIAAAARHLRPGGTLFVEAFAPDLTRFDSEGRRVEHRPAPDGAAHIVYSVHDVELRSIHVTHELADPAGVQRYEVRLHYATVEELDDLARAAGLHLVARWHDWTRTDARPDTTDPINVYR